MCDDNRLVFCVTFQSDEGELKPDLFTDKDSAIRHMMTIHDAYASDENFEFSKHAEEEFEKPIVKYRAFRKNETACLDGAIGESVLYLDDRCYLEMTLWACGIDMFE